MDKVETIEVKADFLEALNEEIKTLKADVEFYKKQMYEYITKYENLKNETDLTS